MEVRFKLTAMYSKTQRVSIYLLISLFISSITKIHAQEDNWLEKISLGLPESKDDVYYFQESLSLDITHNRFLGDINQIQQYWNSIGVNVNSMRDIPLGVNSMFSVAIGVRFAFNNFRNNGVMHIIDTTQNTQLHVLADSISRDRYKFTTNYFELPLEIRFRHEGPDRMIRFSLGGVIGWRMRAFEHWTNGNLRFKEYNYPDINRFRYGVFARVGFKHMAIYAGYYLQPIFKNSGSSNLNILNFGLNIAF
jgi:hypothetical protein